MCKTMGVSIGLMIAGVFLILVGSYLSGCNHFEDQHPVTERIGSLPDTIYNIEHFQYAGHRYILFTTKHVGSSATIYGGTVVLDPHQNEVVLHPIVEKVDK